MWEYLVAGALAIPLVLLARLVASAFSLRLVGRGASPPPYTVSLLTWGGLRGGLAVALALVLRARLPAEQADVLLVMTYLVVVFSILVQAKPSAPSSAQNQVRPEQSLPPEPQHPAGPVRPGGQAGTAKGNLMLGSQSGGGTVG